MGPLFSLAELRAVADEFLGGLLVQGYSVNTHRAYRHNIYRYLDHLAEEGRGLEDVDHACLLRFMSKIRVAGGKEAALHQHKASVTAWYRWLMRIGKAKANPMEMLQHIKLPKTVPKPVEPAKTAKILNGVGQMSWRHKVRNKAILETLYASGVRREELRGVDLGDLHLDGSEPHLLIRYGKGKADRLAKLNQAAVSAIKAYLPVRGRVARKWELGQEQPLFLSQKGRRLSAKQLYTICVQIARELIGEHMSPHQWRHSFATDMLNDGAHIMVIKTLLGHDRLSSTERYLRVAMKLLNDQYSEHHPRR